MLWGLGGQKLWHTHVVSYDDDSLKLLHTQKRLGELQYQNRPRRSNAPSWMHACIATWGFESLSPTPWSEAPTLAAFLSFELLCVTTFAR